MNKYVKNDDAGIRLDRWLKENLTDTSFTEIQKIIRTGQVRVGGGRKKSDYRVTSGDEIRIPPNFEFNEKHKSYQIKKDNFLLSDITIYEDLDVIVVNKPYGLPTQGGVSAEYHVDSIIKSEDPRYRLVHRLDKNTTGALLIAKNRKAAQYYTEAFNKRVINKKYLALTNNLPKKNNGIIDYPLEIKNKNIANDTDKSQEALTYFKIKSSNPDGISLVELTPHTGRKHQIRKHLSMFQCPIIGDKRYGNQEYPLNIEKKIYLHSYEIIFPNTQNTRDIRVIVEMPNHFKNAVSKLGLHFDE